MQHRNGEVLVWDLPTRLFHWLLVIAVIVCFVTGQIGGAWMDWHTRSGLAIVGLIVFRLVWGIFGSPTARFSSFVRGPRAVRDYLKGQWSGIGHSPLGAIAVLMLLTIVGIQVGSGLLANDDIAFQGPLADLLSKNVSDQLRAWHSRLFYVLAVLVMLHVAAIVFYLRVKRENLVRPMFTGWKQIDRDLPAPSPRHSRHSRRWPRSASLLLALLIAGVSVYAADGGFLAAPTAAPAPTPAW